MKRIVLSAMCMLAVAGIAQAQAPTRLAGEWKLAFTSESNSGEPTLRPSPWITFTATVVQIDSTLGGAMRSDAC